MSAYLLRRLLYALPILIGVNLLTFVLFFVVNRPEQMARLHLGTKHVTPQAITQWLQERGYDLPLLYNAQAQGLEKFSRTLFVQKSLRLFMFDFGRSDNGRDIARDIRERMGPSLAIAVPALGVSLAVNIACALLLAFFRGTYLDTWGVVLCVAAMSVSVLYYYIGGQFVLARWLHLAPVSGYTDGWEALRFVWQPVVLGVLAGAGASIRWYRTVFLEQVSQDFVRTARAKGLPETLVMRRHVLRNALLPILTAVVSGLPLLFMGSLILESFFGIPGLGSYTIEAIQQQDFAIVRSMVFLGTVLYILGLVLTDLSYALADPRVRLS